MLSSAACAPRWPLARQEPDREKGGLAATHPVGNAGRVVDQPVRPRVGPVHPRIPPLARRQGKVDLLGRAGMFSIVDIVRHQRDADPDIPALTDTVLTVSGRVVIT